MTEDICIGAGCCWNASYGTCFHAFPSHHSYKVKDWRSTENALNLLESKYLSLQTRREKTPYARNAVPELQSLLVPVSRDHLRLFIYDPNAAEPTVTARSSLENSNFKVHINGPDYFSLEVYRRSDNSSLFKTSLSPKIASTNYWEMGLLFSRNGSVFGLGELQLPTEPKVLYNSGHRLGANPFVISLDPDGRAHGVLFHNPGPMEFHLLEHSNLLIVKSLSTWMWDLSVFAGPTPADVMAQYTSLDGLGVMLPPSWALGLHVCRDIGNDDVTLMSEHVHNFTVAAAADIPYESDCLHEGLMDSLDFTLSEEVMPMLDEVQNAGRRIMISLPAQIRAYLAHGWPGDFFVRNEHGNLYLDVYRGYDVCFPDLFDDNVTSWISSRLEDLLNTSNVNVGISGFVLQDNWPASNGREPVRESMDYVPDGSLSKGTLWWMARDGDTPHYLKHNEYGLQHAKTVASNLNLETHLVLSAATFTGTGAMAGSHAHAVADVECTWNNMKKALSTALGLGLAGVPLASGGPVCGSGGEYDEELCLRWYHMSTMLPLIRVSSVLPLRDPLNLASGYCRSAVKTALEMRYSLLAYLYTLFYEASLTGVPVARPMFFDFPADNTTWTLDEQYMLGSALLVRPAFYSDAVTVPVYLPNENTTWYHFLGGNKVNNGTGRQEITVFSLDKQLVVLVRGGFIIPVQEPKVIVRETLSSPYTLLVALKCTVSNRCDASGSLYVDSDLDFSFTATEQGVEIQSSCNDSTSSPILDAVTVYGLDGIGCDSVNIVNGSAMPCFLKDQVLKITDMNLQLCNREGIIMEWNLTNIPESTTLKTTAPTTIPSTSDDTIDSENTDDSTTDTAPSTTSPETTDDSATDTGPSTISPETTDDSTTDTAPSTTNPETTDDSTTDTAPSTTDDSTIDTAPTTTDDSTTDTAPSTTDDS
ncbi:hypothetical protein ANN_10905, partial [Periplaneta americana]